jgi:hypothetical protein
MKAAVAGLGLLVGLFALVLQFSLSIPLRMSNGHDLIDALLFFFTYFTILSNLMLVLIYLSELVGWRWLAWWRSPVTRGTMLASIALVMGFYHFVLAGIWDPQGWFRVADVSLHYVTPTLFIIWWLAFQPKGTLRLAHLGAMLLPPAIWLGWAMARGAVVNEYPYPILEAHKLGYGAVAINIAVVLVVLLVLFAATVGLDRLLARAAPR